MTITNDVAELLAAAYPLAHDEGCMPDPDFGQMNHEMYPANIQDNRSISYDFSPVPVNAAGVPDGKVLLDRLQALAQRQRLERGDYLSYGFPDPEIVAAIAYIEAKEARP